MDKEQKLKGSHSNPFDFLIVGQGIAGSVMALSLIKDGYSVCVIDHQDLSLSSRIAAGIWNPVVFKRLSKSWLADDLVPELINFYETAEKELGISILTKRFILKSFTEDQEKILWQKKAQSENTFLDPCVYENFEVDKNSILKSYSKVLHAGNIDTIAFLETTKNYISKHQTFINESFDYTEFKQLENGVSYKSIQSKHIIFCEGHLISKNPYFNWIPFKPAKGEVLTIICNNLTLGNSILNKGFFILPLGNNAYKIGATYEWSQLNDNPTETKKQDLIAKLNAVITEPYQIIKHEAGVRPAVIDRRPVIGSHPVLNNFFVFNGFGTKAIMLAPYFAKQFIHYFKNNTPLKEEVNPMRFYKKNDVV